MSRHATRLSALLGLTSVVACNEYEIVESDKFEEYGGYDKYEEYRESEDSGSTEDCDTDAPVVLYMSPDDSNSMSSPVQVRAVVAENPANLVLAPVRSYEFMNYFRWDYEPAPSLDDLALHAAMIPDPSGEEGRYVLQFALSSGVLSKSARPPLNLALSMDNSGSMGGEPIELSRTVARTIAGQLEVGDRISLLTWDASQTVLLEDHAVSGPDDPTVLAAIDTMEDGGGTDLSEGLAVGYQLLAAHHEPGTTSRMLLMSDGGANLGTTDEDLIAEHAGGQEDTGIYMVGVGVGEASFYNDLLMNHVTDIGKGAAVFIDSEQEASRVFDEDFVSVFEVAARNVKVELTLPPGFEIVRTTAEQVSEDAAEVQDQHLSPNDSMVFHQDIVACDAAALQGELDITIEATWQDPHTFEGVSLRQGFTFDELLAADQTELRKGRAVALSAEALRAYQEEGASSATLEALLAARDAIDVAQALDPDDQDLEELEDLIAAFL